MPCQRDWHKSRISADFRGRARGIAIVLWCAMPSLSSRSSRRGIWGLVLLGIVACGGSVASLESGQSSSGGGPSTTATGTATSPTATSTTPTTGRIPKLHRAVATACDNARQSWSLVDLPDAGPPYVGCRTHEECTEGRNGRCTGNGHDGWRCSYDACLSDGDCGSDAVCACEGGFRIGQQRVLVAERMPRRRRLYGRRRSRLLLALARQLRSLQQGGRLLLPYGERRVCR